MTLLLQDFLYHFEHDEANDDEANEFSKDGSVAIRIAICVNCHSDIRQQGVAEDANNGDEYFCFHVDSDMNREYFCQHLACAIAP